MTARVGANGSNHPRFSSGNSLTHSRRQCYLGARSLSPRHDGHPTMQKLSAYILTYNEAAKIEAAVASVLWADEVVVVELL